MKIEKISDTQIRCTLNRSDLLSREIKISELAYGTEKAKSLFHDMISQASHQFGFEANDLPLMIEAIPVSQDCIVLIITKVDDPEELDTRFSNFSPSDDYPDLDDDEYYDDDEDFDGLDGFDSINAKAISSDSPEFVPITETVPDISEKEDGQEVLPPVILTRMFSFDSWKDASAAASHIVGKFTDQSSLYKNPSDSRYYLTITGEAEENGQFLKICNQLSEFGKKEKHTYATAGYLTEHCTQLIKADAIRILAEY